MGSCLWSHLFSGLSEWIDVAHPRREILAHVVLLLCPDAEARRFDESLEFYSLLRQLDIGLVRAEDATVRIEGSPLGQELAERVSYLSVEGCGPSSSSLSRYRRATSATKAGSTS